MLNTQNSKFKKLGIALVLVATIALSLGAFTYVKADGNPNDYAVRSLSTYLDAHPDSEVAKLLARVVLTLNGVNPDAIGAARANPESDESPVYGLAYRVAQTNKAIVEKRYHNDLTYSATTTDYWCNNLGVDINVENAYVNIDGTVSSTQTYYIATSTGSGLALYTTIPFSTIIDAKLVATSTVDMVRRLNSNEDQGTNGTQGTVVTNGQCVVVQVLNPYSNGCTGALCEAVTSTNNGHTDSWGFKYNYIKNL